MTTFINELKANEENSATLSDNLGRLTSFIQSFNYRQNKIMIVS